MPGSPKGRILSAAAELFAARGYSAIGTREIAECARVNECTLFRHFGSKRELLKVLIERHGEAGIASQRINAKRLAQVSVAEAASIYVHWYAQVLDRNWVRLYLSAGMEDAELLPQAPSPMHAALAELLAAEQLRGHIIEGDTAAFVSALRLAIVGRAVFHSIGYPKSERGTTPDDVSPIMELWLRGIRR